MKKFSQFGLFVAFFVATFVACQQGGGGKDTKDGAEDPELILTAMNIAKQDIDKADLLKPTWPSITVDNAKATLTSNDILAKFKYGKGGDKPFTVHVSKENLDVGNNSITLTVPQEKGKHKAWTHALVVVRKADNGGGGGGQDVHFKMKSFKLKTNDSPLTWKLAVEKDGKWEVEVPNAMTKVEAATDAEAYFEWDGMGTPSPRKLDFTVEGGFPIQLAEPSVAKEVKITVPASEGVYPVFNATIVIKRKSIESLQLKKIKIQSAVFEKKEIKDLGSGVYEHDKPTPAQSVNVFFYSDENAQTEDIDLVNAITTEPELKKVGTLKVWELNEKANVLKIKVKNILTYTVKINRAPLEVDVIAVTGKTSNAVVANPVKEGASYTSQENELTLFVTPKQHFKYKKITAQLENETPIELKQPTGPTATELDPYEGNITIKDGNANNITIKVVDPSEKDELALVRKFTVTKSNENPATDPIDPSVAIASLYLGDGLMDKNNINKFEAQKVAGDDHRYTAHVLKSYRNQQLALIVQGGASALGAKITDEATQPTPDVLANGTGVFKSNATYYEVKANQSKYVFMLTNGVKKAQYEVTVTFDVVKQNKITVTQPASDGQIKFYTLKGGVRTDLTIETVGGKHVVKVDDGTGVYIELVANEGKKPKKLIVDGTPHTSVTTIAKQTVGAIAVRVVCKKDFEVSGECGE